MQRPPGRHFRRQKSEEGRWLVPARSSVLYPPAGAEKKRSKQKLEVLYCSQVPEVLIDPYVMNESKLMDIVVALWPPVKFGKIYTYFSNMSGQFTRQDEIPKSKRAP